MKSTVAVLVVLLATAGVQAQQRHGHGGAPPPKSVPPTTPSPSPFEARPGTYAPHYDRPAPLHAGLGRGASIYNGTLGFGPSAVPTAPPPAPERRAPAAAVAPEPPTAAPPVPTPVPEPPRVAMAHGPDTFYVIPGCYAGNRPPIPERLPKGCDLTRMRTTPIR